MSLILALETSTKNCSVALVDSGKLLSIREEYSEKYSHAEQLNIFIKEVLTESNKKMTDLSAIAVSKGPGSYTGLRIGISTAKGLCYALNLPLIAIGTLPAMARGAREIFGGFEVYVPMIDARRMEVFTQSYDAKGDPQDTLRAAIIDQKSFDHLLEKDTVFFGDGAEKCKDVLKNNTFAFESNFHPSAKDVAFMADEKFANEEFEDVAYFEPFYLKDFIAGPPKKAEKS